MSSNQGARRLAVTGNGLWRTGHLPALLDDFRLVRVRGPLWSARADFDAVLGWGSKPSARRATALAARRGLPLVRIEDGFLRSLGLGVDDPPLSIVFDDEGIYYDARRPSRLESLVLAGADEAGLDRAARLRDAWCRGRVSKYNGAREALAGGPPPGRYVLLVDQTAGDLSIEGALADADAFPRMLEAARVSHPDCRIVLKVHPDVVAGRKRGHFDLQALARDERVQIVDTAVHPVLLIERAVAVYVVSSQLGFEALLHGRPVHTFGMPFYAGWGLTRDALPAPSRRRPASLCDLVHAALIAYPRYLDPETGARCEPEKLIEWMALQRRQRERFPAQVTAVRFSPWKRRILRRFLPGSRIHFVSSESRVAPGDTVVTWGSDGAGRVPGRAAGAIVVEDGFLRSVGLGADLVSPLSWVLDDVGIYYDASRPSRVEMMLQAGVSDGELLERAALLRRAICAAAISKYNLGGSPWARPSHASRVILVPGQVENDASLRTGAPGIRTNIELLRTVRRENPDAWVVYKPHPDVVAGLRRAGRQECDAGLFCDEQVVDAAMPLLLDVVDEVHVLTSLAGFEALLRGRRVVCHGAPFYSGWGLTDDRVQVARRTRRCTIDELVAASLILYPLYVSRVSGTHTSPERALEELVQWASGPDTRSGWRFQVVRALLRWRAKFTA